VVALFALFSLKVEAKYIYPKQQALVQETLAGEVAVKSNVVAAQQIDSTVMQKFTQECRELVPAGIFLKDFAFVQVQPKEERSHSLVLTAGNKYALASVSSSPEVQGAYLLRADLNPDDAVSMIKGIRISKNKRIIIEYEIQQTAVYRIVLANESKQPIDVVAALYSMGQFDITQAKPNKDSLLLSGTKVAINRTKESPNDVFFIVEEMPKFKEPGYTNAMDYIQKNVKLSESTKEKGVKGKVYVSYIVDTVGRVVNVKVVRGLEPTLDNEAVRVVSSMPPWTPGMQRGKAVNVAFTSPVKFE